MQISPITTPGLHNTGIGVSSRADVNASALTPAASLAQPIAAKPSLRSTSQLRADWPWRDSQFNQRIATGQQTLHYLDELGQQLDTLKTELSAQLANPAVQRPIERRIQQISATWSQRSVATLGGLDAQLRFHADAQSLQTFQVKGLSHKALQEPARETLSFSTGTAVAADKRIPTVIFEPHQGERARINLLDRALAPAQIRVSQGPQGDVLLTTPEAQWSTVRDSLSIRGDGVRFAGPQFHRVHTVLQPEALNPSQWSVNEVSAQRATLQQVLPALQKVQQTRAEVRAELQATEARWAQRAEETQWANNFVKEFAQIADRPAYAVFAALAPAVQGISRPRVEALLADPYSAS